MKQNNLVHIIMDKWQEAVLLVCFLLLLLVFVFFFFFYTFL